MSTGTGGVVVTAVPPRTLEITRRSLASAVVVCVIVVLYVAQASLPPNALTLPLQTSIAPQIAPVLPQGWAFFTKSPRDEEILPFAVTGVGALESLSTGPNSDPRHAFGLSRGARAQGVEIGTLLYDVNVSEEDWVNCVRLSDCADVLEGQEGIRVENESPGPTLCGPVALVRHEPRPWAWRHLVDEHLRPVSALQLDVRCGSA
ncbi:conserved hypothetical protein [Cellulomonas flavigena DSM 20109]|uniref:SdpA family antimicrobial peptide system protein n=1 Tax=Cellulomonas flavigena (strain ATCC 482 / DSM 20109 / BCRC 11376 / JCM 18109 / NBRC 3775 / NCIMB 8073 / NRS 134) TaxID=446466 RepID=D5UBY7_CELFN|nr:SdpA family antimicrobial peptide system protein [Cellulomonas flavigena]ADG76146.1 conserved hypothetical protein [Cellulomonas flavigena DSM 20109]